MIAACNNFRLKIKNVMLIELRWPMKVFRLLIILILALSNIYSFTATDTQVTIFVHGTRRLSKLFIHYTHKVNKIIPIKEVPTSYITHSIADSLAKTDAIHFAKKHFYVFGWSGKLNHSARVDAAKILYNEIIELVETLKKEDLNPIINLITHSHGGNVALNLATCCNHNDLTFHINNLILLACPVQEQTRTFINHPLFKNVYNIYSTFDLTQIIDPQGWHPENKNKKVPFFSQRTFDFCSKLKQAKIEINNWGISHAGFLFPTFFNHLPDLLDTMKQLPSHFNLFIKI